MGDPQLFSLGVVILVSGGMILTLSVLAMAVMELAGRLTDREAVNMMHRAGLGGCLLILGAFSTLVL